MSIEFNDEERPNPIYNQMSLIRHVIMGGILLFIAFSLYKTNCFINMPLQPQYARLLAAILALYGIFRLYRGVQIIMINRK